MAGLSAGLAGHLSCSWISWIRTVPDTTLMRLWGWVALLVTPPRWGRGLRCGQGKGQSGDRARAGRDVAIKNNQPPEAILFFKKIFICYAGS